MTSSLREVDDVDDGEETNECHRRYLMQNYKCAAVFRLIYYPTDTALQVAMTSRRIKSKGNHNVWLLTMIGSGSLIVTCGPTQVLQFVPGSKDKTTQ